MLEDGSLYVEEVGLLESLFQVEEEPLVVLEDMLDMLELLYMSESLFQVLESLLEDMLEVGLLESLFQVEEEPLVLVLEDMLELLDMLESLFQVVDFRFIGSELEPIEVLEPVLLEKL